MTNGFRYVIATAAISAGVAIAAMQFFGSGNPFTLLKMSIQPLATVIDDAHPADEFDVQANDWIVSDVLKKHFPGDTKFDDYGTYYIDNERNKYVFIMDKSDAVTESVEKELKSIFGEHVSFTRSKNPHKKLVALAEKISEGADKIEVEIGNPGAVVPEPVAWRRSL